MKRQLFLMAIMAICSATTLMAQGIVRTGIYMQDGTMHFVRPTTDLHVKLAVCAGRVCPLCTEYVGRQGFVGGSFVGKDNRSVD